MHATYDVTEDEAEAQGDADDWMDEDPHSGAGTEGATEAASRDAPRSQLDKGKAKEDDPRMSGKPEPDNSGSRWTRTPVSINVPCSKRMQDPGSKPYTGPGFMHRNLVDVIKEKVSDPDHFARFHTEPYELLHQPEKEAPSRVHGELYTSDAFLQEHKKVQDGPGPDNLERVVVGLMFASDAAQLTKFSDAKLWPLYMSFGNDSKELRTKPSNGLMEPVAFFEQVCKSFLCDMPISDILSYRPASRRLQTHGGKKSGT